ncbi:hypothetical protein PYCCODRAFT_1451615 [Trametes coccinea BRFM310]|uniref:N-acetyltransferase domain-containing protein n=1 Tax=Trametes coccinea (strain BRFM310) TaxID=1353009 RepID=A0A1Y2IS35_TRAC3|nr:hypothetical protein PYCCODRAFT_1451615 [Trametes coccinea BRFM310]
MIESVATIRPVEASDQKRIRFVVGKAEMEPIAIANRKLYSNPLVISLWIGVSCVFIEYMNWWPKPEHGLLGYLAPLPAFGALSVVLMFAIDWLNRWDFDDRSNHVLRRPDLVDIPTYYSRSPSSGCWILEWGGRFVGMIALDASPDADADEQVTPGSVKKDRSGQVKMTKGTAKVATIRHFHVEEPYRPAGMQNDLLSYALKHAFTVDPKLEGVRATASPLRAYISESLKRHGFRHEKKGARVGALRWQNSVYILDRAQWASLPTE